MSWVAAAVVGGSVIGGAMSSKAAKSAAAGQTAAAEAAAAESARQYDQSRADLAPYRDAGSAAVLRIRDLLGLNAGGAGQEATMAMDPGYQFRLDEGNKALTNRLSAMGLRNSGAALKAGTRYSQDYASGEYGNIYNRLANTAGMGQGAVNSGVQAGQNYAGSVGNYMTGAANARGAAAIGSANAYGNSLGNVSNYFAQQDTLNKIMNRPPTGYGGYGGGSPY